MYVLCMGHCRRRLTRPNQEKQTLTKSSRVSTYFWPCSVAVVTSHSHLADWVIGWLNKPRPLPGRAGSMLQWAGPLLTNGKGQSIKQETGSSGGILPVFVQTRHGNRRDTSCLSNPPPSHRTWAKLNPPIAPHVIGLSTVRTGRRAGGRHTL